MASSPEMSADCAAVWQKHYAHSDAAVAMLTLGHTVYSRITEDEAALLRSLRSDLCTGFAGVHSRLDAASAVSSAKGKQVAKGVAFEEAMLAQLQACTAFSSAARMTTSDLRGKRGIDLCVTDHHGTTCLIELKDKQNITPEDLTKFEEDVKNSPESIFVFLKKGGIGSCRKLIAKPLIEQTADGKIIIWFRGDEHLFLSQLPFLLSTSKSFQSTNKRASHDMATVYGQALENAKAHLNQSLDEVKVKIAALSKEQTALEKQHKRLESGLRQIEIDVHQIDLSPFPKKIKLQEDDGVPLPL